MSDAWLGGSIGTFTERDVAEARTERLGLSDRQRGEFPDQSAFIGEPKRITLPSGSMSTPSC